MEKFVVNIMENAKKDIIVIKTISRADLDIAKKIKRVSNSYIFSGSL